jgi:hypothetical protein
MTEEQTTSYPKSFDKVDNQESSKNLIRLTSSFNSIGRVRTLPLVNHLAFECNRSDCGLPAFPRTILHIGEISKGRLSQSLRPPVVQYVIVAEGHVTLKRLYE